jgi:hypothetical protein
MATHSTEAEPRPEALARWVRDALEGRPSLSVLVAILMTLSLMVVVIAASPPQ